MHLDHTHMSPPCWGKMCLRYKMEHHWHHIYLQVVLKCYAFPQGDIATQPCPWRQQRQEELKGVAIEKRDLEKFWPSLNCFTACYHGHTANVLLEQIRPIRLVRVGRKRMTRLIRRVLNIRKFMRKAFIKVGELRQILELGSTVSSNDDAE